MSYSARFRRGSTTLTIDRTIYQLGLDFEPPALAMQDSISSGTSANRYDGGELVGRGYANRTFSFSVRINASGAAKVLAYIRALEQMIRRTDEPGYFEWKADELVEPLWGQLGAYQRLEIISGKVDRIPDFLTASVMDESLLVMITLTVKPFALGSVHRVATASGGVYEDVTGSNQATGTRVLAAATNKMTNPAFTHGTYSNGWTAGSSLTVAQNTDERYLYPGSPASPKITSRASTNNTYTQSINVGNTNAHSVSAIVARPDGAAVTSADCQIYYNAAQTTTFESLGNGLYLAYTDNVTGINSATATGLLIASGRTVYLLAAQIEEAAAHTPIIFGDMLGCAWTSTAHASTSSTTAGKIALPVVEDATLNIGSWSIYFNWRPDYSSSAANDRYIVTVDGATDVTITYDDSDNDFALSDGTNTATTTGAAFSAGDDIHGVATAGPSGLALYIYNATSGQTLTATNANYAIPATVTNLFIGSDASSANQCNGRLSVQTYGAVLTSAEATAVMQAAAKMVAAGQRPTVMPFLWTKDGDNVVDNCNDSTRDNWAVIAGVPGNERAELTMLATLSANFNSKKQVYLSMPATRHFLNPSYTYFDSSDTVDANSSGGQYGENVLTSDYNSVESFTVSTNLMRQIPSSRVYALARTADGIGSGTMYYKLGVGALGEEIYSPVGNKASSTTMGNILVGPVDLPEIAQVGALYRYPYAVRVRFLLSPEPPSGNARQDYMQLMFSPLVRLRYVIGGAGTVLHLSKHGLYYCKNTGTLSQKHMIEGDVGDFAPQPGQYNLLISVIGAPDVSSVITETITYTWVEIIPRWALL